jgi:phytoene desaturase
VQLFDRFATYNGSNPYRAPGMLTLIPHLEHHYGAYLPQGGMQSITDALYHAALNTGVTFHFNTRVTGLETHKRQITSVLTNAIEAGGLKKSAINTKKHSVDAVLSNMDVWYTYRELLPQIKAPERVLNQARSTSALIFYWGVKGVFPMLSVHSIFFAADYRAEFEALSAGSVLYDDPTVYINVTSKLLPDDAPAGCENWFVMINVPYGENIDWQTEVPRLRKIILRKIEGVLGIPIESLIETEAVLTPEDIDHKTGSYLGSLYGTSSDSTMAAFRRHPNFSRQIKNLFFAGGSVHPGGGIPLCLQSAKIASGLIHDYFTNKNSV